MTLNYLATDQDLTSLLRSVLGLVEQVEQATDQVIQRELERGRQDLSTWAEMIVKTEAKIEKSRNARSDTEKQRRRLQNELDEVYAGIEALKRDDARMPQLEQLLSAEQDELNRVEGELRRLPAQEPEPELGLDELKEQQRKLKEEQALYPLRRLKDEGVVRSKQKLDQELEDVAERIRIKERERKRAGLLKSKQERERSLKRNKAEFRRLQDQKTERDGKRGGLEGRERKLNSELVPPKRAMKPIRNAWLLECARLRALRQVEGLEPEHSGPALKRKLWMALQFAGRETGRKARVAALTKAGLGCFRQSVVDRLWWLSPYRRV